MLKEAMRNFPNPRTNHVFSRWHFLGLEHGGIPLLFRPKSWLHDLE